MNSLLPPMSASTIEDDTRTPIDKQDSMSRQALIRQILRVQEHTMQVDKAEEWAKNLRFLQISRGHVSQRSTSI